MKTAQHWIDRLDEVSSERDQQNWVKAIQKDARTEPLRKYRVEKYAHRQTEAARNNLARKYNLLAAAVSDAVPLLKHYRNQLASSLSCDSRSHDNDREPRRQINAILEAVNNLNQI